MTIVLDHLQIAIPPGGEEQARSFYSGLLGLAEMPKPAALAGRGGLWFHLDDGVGLHLGVEPGFRPARKAHPGLRVTELDALLARCAASGLATAEERDPFGRRRLYLDDPFGNRIELVAAD